MIIRKRYQRGAATLVGVLIAMVIAGTGLYALMQTQGEMTSGIASSKARAEAMVMAQKRGESIRAYIEQAQFSGSTSHARTAWATSPNADNDDNTEIGVNATFFEEWIIRDATGGNYKEVIVKVSWNDETGDLQRVFLNNFIVFTAPGLMTSLKQQFDGSNRTSKLAKRGSWGNERVEEGTEGDTRDGSDTNILSEPGLSGDDLFSRKNSKGNWELYVMNGGSPLVVFTSFGGIIHQIRGKIHFNDVSVTKSDLAKNQGKFTVIATSPGYCEFPIYTTDGSGCNVDFSDDHCAEYFCFVPGDCANEATYDVTGFTGFNSTAHNEDCVKGIDSSKQKEHFEHIKSLELEGGWYGKVGLFGSLESLINKVITGDSCDDPARSYTTHRLCRTTGSDVCADSSLITAHNTSCESQKNCSFQLSDISTYTGYISHCEGSGENELIYTDGFCDAGVPHAIYVNEGINRSATSQHFWLVKNDKKCDEILLDFSEGYLASHKIPRILSPLIDPPVLNDPNANTVAEPDHSLDSKDPP